MKPKIKSVNYHLWEPCNMRCQFCFASFQDVKKMILPKGHLPKEKAFKIIESIAGFGFEKITFVGGEPTLCPWLSELISLAKTKGLTTMIVTNGTNLTDEFLEKNKKNLDWITISIDSISDETNIKSGRAFLGKNPISKDGYKELFDRIKKYNFRIKINTVVHKMNYEENLVEIIKYAMPERWKIFQVLPVKEQNDEHIKKLEITHEMFDSFVSRHKKNLKQVNIISENNNEMSGSYAMIDPAGRFFDNVNGKHKYSSPILEIGIENAIEQIEINHEKFINRGGDYNWRSEIPARITISGNVGSGKTTIGKLLAKKMNYKFESIGDLTREVAAREGLTIVEFQKICDSQPHINLELDKEFSTKFNKEIKFVLDYRMGFKFVENSYNIFLSIHEKLARERLKSANRFGETHVHIETRNRLFKSQFQKLYNLDYTNPSNYDLYIDVDNESSPEEIVDLILKNLNYEN